MAVYGGVVVVKGLDVMIRFSSKNAHYLQWLSHLWDNKKIVETVVRKQQVSKSKRKMGRLSFSPIS